MKAKGAGSNPPNSVVTDSRHRAGQYRKVVDGRKQPIRGLWLRNDRFYGWLAGNSTGMGNGNLSVTKKLVTLSTDGKILILLPGAPTNGWQVGGLPQHAIAIGGTSSCQTFRNLRATGCGGDIYNIHGFTTALLA